MPNGGMLPCCQVCQWATASKNRGEIACKQHQLTIRHSHYTFCSLLFNDPTPGLAHFIASRDFESDTLYAWIEIGYRDPKVPGLPMYHHKYAALSPVKDYGAWTEDEDTSARRALHEEVLEQLKRQGDEQ